MFAFNHHRPIEPKKEGDVLVIRITDQQGNYREPVYIPRASDFLDSVAEAVSYFGRTNPDCSVTLHLDRDLISLGISNMLSISSWSETRERLNREYLTSLFETGIDVGVVKLVAGSLKVRRNRHDLIEEVQKIFNTAESRSILNALDLASEAHSSSVAAREQDREGLFYVPYVNHPICIALQCIRVGLSAQAVQAALLHDVIEDEGYTEEDLFSRGIDAQVVSMVRALSKKEDETREHFLDRISAYTGELRAIKCLDRFDNLIRAFAIPDLKYAERVIREDREIYHRLFSEAEQLASLYPDYRLLHQELAKKWAIAA